MTAGPDALELDVGCRSVEPLATHRRTLSRPSDGIRTESFGCETCGKTVTVKVVARKTVMRLRTRAAIRLVTLLAFASAAVWTVGTRGLSAGRLLLVGLGLVCVLVSVPQIVRLFATDFRLALDADLQRELERAHSGSPVHVFSPPGRGAWK